MWKCIPVAVFVCSTVTPIPHIGRFIHHHPLPICAMETECHYIWEPDLVEPLPEKDEFSDMSRYPTTPPTQIYYPYTFYVNPPVAPGLYPTNKKKTQPQPPQPPNTPPRTDVPEPSTFILLLSGLYMLLMTRRQKRSL